MLKKQIYTKSHKITLTSSLCIRIQNFYVSFLVFFRMCIQHHSRINYHTNLIFKKNQKKAKKKLRLDIENKRRIER